MKASKLISLLLALLLTLGCTALAAEKEAAYLDAYYGIGAFEETVSLDAFNAALEALEAEKIDAEALTLADAVTAAVKLANMEALALTYLNADAPDKAANKLAEAGVTVADGYAPYVACAIDLGLIAPDADFSAAVTGEQASALIYDALEMAGDARHYIGRVSDPDILGKIRSTLDSYAMFDDELLTDVGVEIVIRGATTGYNLKYAGYDADFLPEYTLKYGHSDYVHAAQLVGLLKSEGIDAYLQIEPKVSVYEYMIEWGEPGEPTPTYAVLPVEDTGRYLCYAIEYDLMIEFDSTEDKEAFHGLIETYAKKYDDSFNADGVLIDLLLDGAWWQPLYSSSVEMENKEFQLLYDNVVTHGAFSIHPFSLPDNTDAIQNVVAEVAPELSVELQPLYVNPAFYRYITGESHQ